MKFNQFRLIFFLSSIILLSSCLDTSTVSTASSDPSFVSLTFAANDSVPYLSTAVFTLVDKTIVNLDSLPFKTRVDSVYPTFTFTSTAGTILRFHSGYKYKKDSALLEGSGKDTIDFRQPIGLRNYAADAIAYVDYSIITNVHQVDPELYLWNKASDNLNTSITAKSQKTVILNDVMYYYLNNGTSAYLYTSSNGINWVSATVTGLPVNTPLNDMIQFNGKLYLTQDGSNYYTSTDGLTWTKKAVTKYTFKSLLYVLNGQLWAVVKSTNDESYHFAISNDGNFSDTDITTGNIPNNFPVKDFASVSYSSATGKSKVLVLGGYSVTGSILKNNWSSEDGVYWVDFSTENHTLDTLSVGASVISYDNKLLVLGVRNDGTGTSYYRISKDEGLSWQIPDTLRNVLPSGFTPRSYQSAVVFKPLVLKGVQSPSLKDQIFNSNNIFIIGGKTGSSTLTDVWTAKLNRKNFLRQ
jgi:hypothetical protein